MNQENQLVLPLVEPVTSTIQAELLSPREMWHQLSQRTIAFFSEDSRIEYKTSQKINFDKLAEYYSMFSNTVEGGVVVIGINDNKEIVGCSNLSKDKLNKVESFHLSQCPASQPEIKRIEVTTNKGQKDFLIAIYLPYIGALVETSKDEAFIRYGESKKKMSLEERQDFRSSRHEHSYELKESPLSYPIDFDEEIINEFCQNFRERENKDTWSNEEVLIDRLLLLNKEGRYIARNALVLLAAKNPRLHIPGCRVRVQRFAGELEGAGEEFNPIKDTYLEGNIVRIIKRSRELISSLNYDVTWLNKDGKFVTTSEYPQWAWFEALVNACVHRSYSFSGSEITVKFFSNRLEIESPGGFIPPVNKDNIYSQRASRNPHLMEALRYLGFVLMTREGTRRMKQSMVEWNLPEPSFSQEAIHGVSVRVTLKNDSSRKRSTDKDVAAYCGIDNWKQLQEHEIAIIGYAYRNKAIHVNEAAKITGRTWNTSKKDLDRLVKKGLLKFIPPKFTRDPNAHYEIANEDAQKLSQS